MRHGVILLGCKRICRSITKLSFRDLGFIQIILPLVVLDGVLVRVHEPLRDLVAAEGVAVDAEVGVRVDREVLHFDPVVPEVGLQRHRPDDREVADLGVASDVVRHLAGCSLPRM